MQLTSIIYAVLALGFMSGMSYADEDGNNCYQETGAYVRQVTFTSKLNDEKKAYTWCIASYMPSKFKLKINGQKLKDGQSITIPIENNRFIARYDYEFKAMFQRYVGFREAEFEADPNRDHYSIDFSWKNDDRFIIHHARYIRITQTHNDHENLDKHSMKNALGQAITRLR